jgi:uncharacterized protein (DUF488 family)
LATIYTIGHSTRTLEELIEVLKEHGIQVLVDIRSFPGSRRMPWFGREELEGSLPAVSIEYRWMKELGGRRKKSVGESPNSGLRNQSFRNYADHMLSEEFQRAADELVALAGNRRVAIMCAERLFFQCHRMLVSDYLALHGHEVLHIVEASASKPHRLTAEAKLVDGRVVYPGLF